MQGREKQLGLVNEEVQHDEFPAEFVAPYVADYNQTACDCFPFLSMFDDLFVTVFVTFCRSVAL